MTDAADKSALLLTFTDQYNWGFSGSNGIFLNCSTDVDDAWTASVSRVFQRVLRYDFFKGANHRGVCGANREIIELAAAYSPDYVFYPCNFSGIVTGHTLRRLREMGCIVVVDFFDDDALFERLARWMIPSVDYVVTHVPSLVSRYRDLGGRCFLSPTTPVNTVLMDRRPDIQKKHDATFVGSLYSYRKAFIANIAAHGARVQYMGGGNENKLSPSRMMEIFNSSKINVSFSSGRPGRTIVVGRVFEVALCGGFLLSEYVPGIEKWFDVGTEIDCFAGAEEAAEKIQYYLSNPEARDRMAANAFRRAREEYAGHHLIDRVRGMIDGDISINGRPVIPELSEEMNSLRTFEANQYFKWTSALLNCRGPLRKEWRDTARLVLATDPSHSGATTLLARAERWGDPAPLSRAWTSLAAGVGGGFAVVRKALNRMKSFILRVGSRRTSQVAR